MLNMIYTVVDECYQILHIVYGNCQSCQNVEIIALNAEANNLSFF
jgi:hypothetical protein